MPLLRRVVPGVLAALALGACGSSSTEPERPAYELEIIWLGTAPSAEVQAVFETAKDRVQRMVVGGLQTVALPADFTNLEDCRLPGFPDVTRTNIRGLRIYAVVEAIDGTGGTLGVAGPCLVRGNNLPALGVMRFDQADVANLLSSGRLTAVVLHEMLHVVGIGTVWYALVDTLVTPSDVRYTGTRARTACTTQHAGGSVCGTTVPVHSEDGAGSRFSHWRESVFDTELMTPFLDNVAPLSAMTIQVLGDLGYTVSTAPAEPYTVPTGMPLRLEERGTRIELAEPMQPRWKLDGAGRLTPYRPRR